MINYQELDKHETTLARRLGEDLGFQQESLPEGEMWQQIQGILSVASQREQEHRKTGSGLLDRGKQMLSAMGVMRPAGTHHKG